MSRMLGLDIGTTAVRAVEVIGVDANGFAVVSRIGIAPVEHGAISGGRIKNPAAVAIAVINAVKQAGIPRYGIVVGAATPDVALSRLLIPASVTKEERIGAVRSLGRPIAPTFTLEESEITSALVAVSPSPDGTALATVDIVAVLDTELAQIEEVCRLARITPRAVDVPGAAMLRSLTRANQSYGEIGTVVDIGASKLTVATRQGLHLRSLRTTSAGGNDLTRALMNVTGESFDEAEARKRSMRLTPRRNSVVASGYFDEDERAASAPLDDALRGAVDVLVDTVAQSIESDAANHGNFTQAVTITGGGALVRGLKERLQARVGVPVSIGRPWAEIERSRRNVEFFNGDQPDPKVLLSIATAVGLALWREPA